MRIYLQLVLLCNLVFAANSFAASSLFETLTPDQQIYWKKLLHFHQGISRADGAHFFISPKGKTDAAAELQADIDAFKNQNAKAGWFNYHPQCVFKERLRFLKEVGLADNIPLVSCPEFDEWEKGLNADSISLVFSTSYPNNPSSVFGHTLIRLNQKNKIEKKQSDILDYAVAFSAIPEKEDLGIVFAAKGMFGGYKGLLEITKYYAKVNEYNNGESRDLIEYDLSMTTFELQRLINHIWEIYQTTYFDYYFADENCSAVLVDILGVAFDKDQIDIKERWFYLPSEMIKHFSNAKNRIKNIHYRPSLKKVLEKNLSLLSVAEINQVKEISKGQDIPSELNNILVLDNIIGLMDFTRYRTKDKLTDDQKLIFRKALLKRASLSEKSVDNHFDYDQSNRPDLGHEPQKLTSFLRTEKSHSLIGFDLKQGYHDLMSNDLGFETFSQFDFLSGAIIFDKTLNQLSLEQLRIVNLTSLHTYTFFDPQFSWSAHAEYNRIQDLDCGLCKKIDLMATLGPTLKLSESSRLTALIGPYLDIAKNFSKGYRVGLEVQGMMFWSPTDKMKLGFFDKFRMDAKRKWNNDYFHQTDLKMSYFPSLNTEWRLESSAVSKYQSFNVNKWINQVSYGIYF